MDYKGLVEFVAKTMADDPAAVDVQAFERHRGALTLKIGLGEGDMGKLIGRGGRNIEALRTLIRVASLKERRKVFVDLA
ncbi:MAG TPA: KH domain-containing protein [Candidatus Dormibacteraeota bacterium]|nr:KH domain-containing protein [Candidatus Dormibacteraeota bacterium]